VGAGAGLLAADQAAGRAGAVAAVEAAWREVAALARTWAAADDATGGEEAAGHAGEAGVVEELLAAGPGRVLRRTLRGVAEGG
jgi:hypothetical protein